MKCIIISVQSDKYVSAEAYGHPVRIWCGLLGKYGMLSYDMVSYVGIVWYAVLGYGTSC